MTAPPPGSRRIGSTRPVRLGLLAIVVLVVAAWLVDVVAGPPAPVTAASTVEQEPATSGVVYCPVTAGEEETAVVSIAAAGGRATVAAVVRYGEQGPVSDAPVEIAPGAEESIALDAAAASRPVAVRWRGGPAVASWRVDGETDSQAPCVSAPSPTWYMTGLQTAEGARSTLHLFNPYTVDAVARVVFGTPEGRQALVLTDAVVVPAGESVRVNLNEVQPEVTDLAVTVEVRAGRLVSQAEVFPAGGGRALVPAVPQPVLETSVPYARADDGGSSQLSVFNPGADEAAVEVVVSDPRLDGTSLPAEVSVPPGAVVRVPLEEASASSTFGVAINSLNEVPVVVARTTVEAGGQPAQRVAVSTARPANSEWAVIGGGTEGRLGVLVLYNPGGEPRRVDVAAEGAPSGWSSIELAPNAAVTLPLDEAGSRAALPVRVSADGPVSAGVWSRSREERPQLWTPLGVPSAAWTGPDERPAVRRDPALGRTPAEIAEPTEDPADEPLVEPAPTAEAPTPAPTTAPAATEPVG